MNQVKQRYTVSGTPADTVMQIVNKKSLGNMQCVGHIFTH